MILKLDGRLIGRRVDSSCKPTVLIVHNINSAGSRGPAENAFVMVDTTTSRFLARYISWINLFDIENAARCEDGWELVEPPMTFKRNVDWFPYGWGGPPVPSVAKPAR